MFINKVTLYLMLAIQSYRISVLCEPLVSPSHVKQAASNQSSTNERFRSTSPYDSTTAEYVNDNEKYDFTRMKIIHKIKSSVPISVQKDPTLIEKKTMEIKPPTDYNSMVRENSDSARNYETRQASNADQHEKFFAEFRGSKKCREKCRVKQASVEPSVLITRNDAPTSHRSGLKRMMHHHILKDKRGEKEENSELKGIFNNPPSSNIIGLVSLTSPAEDDATPADESNSDSTVNHRVRRQLRYIPVTKYGLNNPKSFRLPPTEITNAIKTKRLPNPDPGFIHSLLGVFDHPHSVLAPNVRPIKPDEVIITPVRYIDDAKILPQGLPPTSSPRTTPEDTLFVKNTVRNPSGFGESERVLTTDTIGKKKHTVIIHDHFLPTVRPHTIPKIPSHHGHYYDNTRVQDYPKNHQMPPSLKSMVSATKNRYHETPDRRESYKHHGKDTKYDRYAGKYAFEYHVADVYSANDFGHQETRNEYLTKGNYHVRLPDGRLQKVTYHVDEGGYHANVSYEPNNQYYYV